MISELLPEEKRKLHELEQQLVELERGSISIQAADLYLGLDEIQLQFEELEKLLQKETKTKREEYRRKLSHLKSLYGHVRSSLDSLVRRKERSNLDFNNKAELFAYARLDIEAGEQEFQLSENQALQKSSKMVGEYLSIGQETLTNLLAQRESLKGIQRRAFDILNSLGIAGSLLKAVEGRDSTDRLLVLGGMAVVLVVVVVIWWFLV